MKKQKSEEFNDELHELMKKHDINIYENGGIENILLEAVAPLFKKFKVKIKNKLTFAKVVTVIIGAIGTILAVGLIMVKQDKIFDY
jgi:hypothetical protein